MPGQKHAGQLGKAIGTLEVLADGAPENEAGAFSAAADVLRSYGESLDVEFEPDYPGAVEIEDLRSTVVFLSGHVKYSVSADEKRVLQRAVQYLDERVQREHE
jgi:hypothetical protein